MKFRYVIGDFKYLFVWPFARPVDDRDVEKIRGVVGDYLREAMNRIKGRLIDYSVNNYYIMAKVELPPRESPAFFTNGIKSGLARILLNKFPELRQTFGNRLFDRYYMAFTMPSYDSDTLEELLQKLEYRVERNAGSGDRG